MTAAPSPYPPAGRSPAYSGGQAPWQQAPWAGAPGVAPRPAPKGRRGPVILLVSGLLVLVVGAAIGVASIVSIARTSASLSPVSSTGTSVARLESVTVYGLYEDVPDSTSCSVTSPSGAHVDTVPVAGDVSGHQMFSTFTTTEAGDYTISCTSSSAGSVYIGVALSASGVVGVVVGIIAGSGAAVLGIGLTIGGIVWLAIRNRAIHRAGTPQGGPVPGRPGGYGPQPGAWPAS